MASHFKNEEDDPQSLPIADGVQGGMLEVRDFKKRAKEGEMGKAMHRYMTDVQLPALETQCASQ